MEICGDCDLDASRMGEVEVVHDLHKLRHGIASAEPDIVLPLFTDGGGGLPPVVVAGVQRAVIGQAEELGVHALIEGRGAAALKIGTAASSNHQRIPCECHGRIVENVADTGVGVSRGGADDQVPLPKLNEVTMTDRSPHTDRISSLRDHRLAPQLLPQLRGPSDVVGVNVSLQGELQAQAELCDELGIALDQFQDGIDEQRLSTIGQQVRVGTGLSVEELAEDHDHLLIAVAPCGPVCTSGDVAPGRVADDDGRRRIVS